MLLKINVDLLKNNLLSFTNYIAKCNHSWTLNSKLLNIKVGKNLIEEYEQDLKFIILDLSQNCFEKDLVDIIDLQEDNIDYIDEGGNTFLMKAITHGSNKIADKLLDLKADPFIGDNYGNTAFSIAIEKQNLTYAKKFINIRGNFIDLNQLDTIYNFEIFIVSNICIYNSQFREFIGLDNKKAKMCFFNAESNLQGDLNETDFSIYNEIS